MRFAFLAAALVVAAVPGKAAAGDWSVYPELLTEYPLHVGAGGRIEGPWQPWRYAGVYFAAGYSLAALGGAFTVGSSTSVEARFHPVKPKAKEGGAAIEQEGEDYLGDTYATYVHTPVVTAAVGYRF